MNMMVKLEALNEIISDLQVQVKPQATGHIRTAISVLETERDNLKETISVKVA